MLLNYLSEQYKDLNNFISKEKDNYQNAKPFPHIVINNFFDQKYLNEVLKDFPKNLSSHKEIEKHDNINEKS